ncbi:hypothetical protein BV22DRAFT_1052435 [Leucogyrophana mollusca]|uniref:Uncharacterized protein n=1 Tax=Leucogyrophana mollusca TaxID=85980 RepID=A0ACB8AWS1_9AGAM|nr:hypothetical protein BV22DRAFT_1052435 [Leucogyrophana mollusca]
MSALETYVTVPPGNRSFLALGGHEPFCVPVSFWVKDYYKSRKKRSLQMMMIGRSWIEAMGKERGKEREVRRARVRGKGSQKKKDIDDESDPHPRKASEFESDWKWACQAPLPKEIKEYNEIWEGRDCSNRAQFGQYTVNTNNWINNQMTEEQCDFSLAIGVEQKTMMRLDLGKAVKILSNSAKTLWGFPSLSKYLRFVGRRIFPGMSLKAVYEINADRTQMRNATPLAWKWDWRSSRSDLKGTITSIESCLYASCCQNYKNIMITR